MNKLFYVNTLFTVSMGVFSMSIFEGWLSLSILDMLEPGINQSSLMLTSILPLAVLQGFMTPIILKMVIGGENLFLREAA